MAIRRVVTGHDENLKAYIVSDGPAANVRGQRAGHSSTLIWATDSAPADITSDEDMGARKLGTAPPPKGTRRLIVDQNVVLVDIATNVVLDLLDGVLTGRIR